jgi:hypothetical protein
MPPSLEVHRTGYFTSYETRTDHELATLEIMDLAAIVSDMHAATQNEVEAKKRALDALTSIPAWERDSLYELRHSIERDQLEVNARLYAASLESPQRVGWLSRFDQG